MYKFIRPLLFKLDAETAHRLVSGVGRLVQAVGAESLVRQMYAFEHPMLRTNVLGLDFPNPVGLAAGFDKNAPLTGFCGALGFGHIEVGTVTPRPQAGNPKPRLFRLPLDEALINRMGFNNEGAEAMQKRVSRRQHRAIVGINIGKNKDTPNDRACEDYERCFAALADYADYLVVNVSSPNTPNLRALQDKKPLQELLGQLQALNRTRSVPKPILLKVAPDLTDEELHDIAEVATAAKLAGVIATNTTISRANLKTPEPRLNAVGAGGLSGKPLRERATAVIRRLRRELGGKMPIVGVGGIFSAEDAYEKIRAGASLIQLYTGLVYEGPGIVKRIKKGLVRLLERDGFRSVGEAVGTNAGIRD